MMRSYKSLVVWQIGMDVVTDVYRLTASFPREELVGLTAEMRRSAVAIPANFATGAGGTRDDEYVRNVASGHAHIAELMTYAEIAERLGYLNQRQTTELRGKAEHLDMEVRSFRQALARAQQIADMQHATETRHANETQPTSETRHASRPQHGL